MIDLFEKHHLILDMKYNLKIIDYLDTMFDLTTGLFKPHNKTNNIPRYINAKSNHLSSLLKEILKSVSKRIFSNSCNEQVFNAAAPFYNGILDKCGYSEKKSPLRKNSTRMKKEIEGEILFGKTYHLAKMLKPILRSNFYKFCINILV